VPKGAVACTGSPEIRQKSLNITKMTRCPLCGVSVYTEETPAESGPAQQKLPWYAVRVRSNFEQVVSGALRGKGYESYVPVYRKRSCCADRIKNIDLPLFSGYVFSRIDLVHRLPVLVTPGVVNVVAFGNVFVPIPESEIEAVQAVVRSGLPSVPWPFLREGQRVRIDHGSMTGVEGLLVQIKNDFRIVVSIELLQRSVSVEIDRSWIHPLGPLRPLRFSASFA
jgi:transcriptional antiterminator NusG